LKPKLQINVYPVGHSTHYESVPNHAIKTSTLSELAVRLKEKSQHFLGCNDFAFVNLPSHDFDTCFLWTFYHLFFMEVVVSISFIIVLMYHYHML